MVIYGLSGLKSKFQNINEIDKKNKSDFENKKLSDYYLKERKTQINNNYNKFGESSKLESRLIDSIDGYIDKQTKEIVECYNGVKCEDLIKNLTPQTDYLTGITYYFIGRETYIPKEQKLLFERKIDDLLDKEGLEKNFVNRVLISNKSDVYCKIKLPDGTILTKDYDNNKIIFDFGNKTSELFTENISKISKNIYDELFDIINKNKKNPDKNKILETFWKKYS